MTSNLTTADVCCLMETYGFDEDIIEIFSTNKIDGSTLFELNTKDIKELGVRAYGDLKRLERMMKTERINIGHSSATSSPQNVSYNIGNEGFSKMLTSY